MSDFIRSIGHTMRRLGLNPESTRTIVALSGGADSVALLSALTEIGYKCIAAHCDFHLRGEESERDRLHAKNTAQLLGADYEEIHFDVDEYRRIHQVSVEMACRDLRYAWFKELSQRYGDIPVTVAHHRDDNLETFFLNLLRGTGISGLTGMKPRNGIIVRPMLDTTRKQIEQYLSEKVIAFVVDSSNLVNDVKRNRIRNIILPAIKEQFPGSDRSLTVTMDNILRTDSLYRELLSERAARYISDDGIEIKIDLDRLTSETGESATLLYEILKKYGFNYTQSANIVTAHSAQTSSGKTFHSGEWCASLDRGQLQLFRSSTANPADESYIININSEDVQRPGVEISRLSPNEVKFDRSATTVYLDSSAADGNPEFRFRHWREGDRLSPFGMTGSKLVSDIFSDAKLSLAEKQKVWIMTRDGVPLWIVGMRTSRHFAVTDKSRSVIKIKFIGNVE